MSSIQVMTFVSILTKNEEYLSFHARQNSREVFGDGISMLIDDNSASLRNLCAIN